jgi:superfamily II DNA or RNA helicase
MRTFHASVSGVSVTLPKNSMEAELTSRQVVKQKAYGGKNNGRWLEQEKDIPVFVREKDRIRCGLGAVLFLSKQNPFIDIEFESFEPERNPLAPFTIPKGITNSPKWLVKGKERWYFHEALDSCRKSYCGTVKLCTGSGKTPIILTLAYNQSLQIGSGLILVPTLTIRNQFMKSAQSFGIEVREYREWLYDLEYGKRSSIIISTPGVVTNDLDNNDSLIKEKHSELTYVIADEAHHSSCDTWQSIFMKLPNLQRSHGFSALPIENNNKLAHNFSGLSYEDALTISCVGPIIYERSTKELKDFLNIPSLINITYEWPKHHSETYYDNWHEVRQLIQNEKPRSELISDIMGFLCDKGYVCITHVKEIAYAETLTDLCGTGKVVTWKGGNKVYNGLMEYKVDELRDLIGKEIFGLVCTSHGIEGLDIQGIPINVTIMSEGQKVRQTIQKTGRAVRPGEHPALVINIFDSGISILPRHAKDRSDAIQTEFDSDIYQAKNLKEFREIVSQIELNQMEFSI